MSDLGFGGPGQCGKGLDEVRKSFRNTSSTGFLLNDLGFRV